MAEVFFTSESAKIALDTARKSAGGNTGLARQLGKLTSQAVSQWKHVPAQRVLDVERVTGVPRHQLRPDIYPSPATSVPLADTPEDVPRPLFTASEALADE